MRRGNLGNNDSGEGPSSGAFQSGTASQAKQRELFETLVNQFMSTGNIQYLERATQLGNKLALSDEKLLSVLDDLLEARHARQLGSSHDSVFRWGRRNKRRDVRTATERPRYKSPYIHAARGAQGVAIDDSLMFLYMYMATREIDYLVSAVGAVDGLCDKIARGELGHLLPQIQNNPMFQERTIDLSPYLGNNPQNDEEHRCFQKLQDTWHRFQKYCLENQVPPVQGPAFSSYVGKEVSPWLLQDMLLPAQGKREKPKKHHVHPHRDNAVTKGESSRDLRNTIVADNLESPDAVQFTTVSSPNQAIKKIEERIVPTSTDHPLHAGILDNIGGMDANRHSEFRSLDDLEQAIKTIAEAIAATPTDHPDRALMLMYLGSKYLQKYTRFGVAEGISQAIQCSEEADTELPTDRPERATVLNDLGNQYCHRYRRFGMIKDLEKAIKCSEEVVAAKPKDHPLWGMRLNNLGNQYLLRYRRFGVGGDLEKSIKYSREAVVAIPMDCPHRGGVLSNLGNTYLYRYRKFQSTEDLEQAIKWGEEALAATPVNNPDRAGILNNLSSSYVSRYMHFGVSEDYERGVKHSEAAILEVATDDPNRLSILLNRGMISSARFSELESTVDFEQAIKWSEEGLAATPIDHPIRTGVLDHVTAGYLGRYEQFGAADDLEEAIKRSEERLAATPIDHPTRASALDHVTAGYLGRYERFGAANDLEEVIKRSEEGLAATPIGHPDRAHTLAGLSNGYFERYMRFEAAEDIEQAITLATEAVATTRTQRSRYLSNLGTALAARHGRLGVVTDLEQAIKHGANAAATIATDHRARLGIFFNLGDMYYDRYRLYGNVEDLEQATKWLEEANAEPMNRHDRLLALDKLASVYGTRHEQFSRAKDHEQAMKYSQEAISATPADHPSRAGCLLRMALVIRVRYQKTNSILDFYHLLQLLYECWHCDRSPPHVRIWGATLAAEKLASRHMWQESSSLLNDAVKLLPRAGLRLAPEKNDQEHRLSRFSSLAANATSVGLQAGEDAADSLKILELGRGVMMGSVIDCRSDDSDLRLKYPDIYHQFHLLRRQIDLLSPQKTGDNDRLIYEEHRRQKEMATYKLEEILAVVRELPSFERFQLPLHHNDLITMARDGPIVIINCTKFGSDALMVTCSSIKSLALRKLVHASVEGWMGQMTSLVQGGRRTYGWRNERMKELLLWLWDTTVEPILEALKLDSVISDGTLSHIWWIGVGPLAIAPFHAAGDHSPGSTRNTLSRVISSYIPTIKALSYARQKQLKLLNRSDSRLLLVSMPTTPQAGALRNAETEVERIAAIVGQNVCTTSLKHPSTAQVLAKLPSCDAIHFACHGVSNTDGSPSESHLLLRNEDGTQDKLSVRAISEMNLENAQIAFLSACSTAQNSSQVLADESIYIASAFQLAGFSHVLATQWMSHDAACLEVATEFYRLLFKDEPGGVNDAHLRVSTAFHYAVKKLRDRKLKHPLIWASFIHTGA